jgi:ribosomal RNA-processing protein 36
MRLADARLLALTDRRRFVPDRDLTCGLDLAHCPVAPSMSPFVSCRVRVSFVPSGAYDVGHFDRHYSWLSDAKSTEVADWSQQLRTGKRAPNDQRPISEEEREELKANIQRAKQSIASTSRSRGESTLLREWKHTERLAQRSGKKPFYLKKSETKKLALASRYLELKSTKGALQKFMVKKTKEVKNKDHKYMPREGTNE